MSITPASPSVPPVATKPARRLEARLLVVWAILLGVLIAGWAVSDSVSRVGWVAVISLLYFVPVKLAAYLGLTSEERRTLRRGRLIAYCLWVGAQPRLFLPSYVPPTSLPVPTWRSFLLNVVSGLILLFGIPQLFPVGTPLLVRAWAGLIGVAFLRLFAGFDLWGLVFRWLGFPVDKVFANPAAATSLRDFWGRRWNRIMSGLLRDLVFLPLSRWVGVAGAALVVFLYSGVVHEFVSVLGRGGYGGPTLYFAIQGVAFLCEGTRFGRRILGRFPLVGWCWTMLVVVGPLGLIVPPTFMEDVIVPFLRGVSVPGLPQ
jgi:hypothetical protein